jgi:hypothetical protein
MSKNRLLLAASRGVAGPLLGRKAPIVLAAGLLASLTIGCGDQEKEESLPVLQVGMTKDVPAIYDDGELEIYEVKKGISFPIIAPNDQARRALNEEQPEPYGRLPWVAIEDIAVQVSWTISNLDDDEHVVELLVDPWNEFGRYWPGLQLTDAENQEFMPNFSGIDKRYIVAGKGSGADSRVHGTYAFSDLEEVATDLATVMNIIADPPASENEDEDPRVTYANHAFHWQNRSYKDVLVRQWVPPLVAGLTGLDIGFRTYEPATIAIEVAVEVVDKSGKRIRAEDDLETPLLRPTEEIITVGVAP